MYSQRLKQAHDRGYGAEPSQEQVKDTFMDWTLVWPSGDKGSQTIRAFVPKWELWLLPYTVRLLVLGAAVTCLTTSEGAAMRCLCACR